MAFSRLLKTAHLLRYTSALAAHVPLKYAPLLDPRDALQLNLFEQPAKQMFFNNLSAALQFSIFPDGSFARCKGNPCPAKK
jgi:hypothetical protein